MAMVCFDVEKWFSLCYESVEDVTVPQDQQSFLDIVTSLDNLRGIEVI